MILYDPALNMNFHDYGIMLPISPDRGKQILEYMDKHYYPGARGATMPYPGPVFNIAAAMEFLGIDAGYNYEKFPSIITREDLERVHSKDFIDSLFGREKNSLESALLATFELIDSEGRRNRYEPERAKKPLCNLLDTIIAQIGGAYLACRLALEEGPGFCFYMGGGMHHARYDSGSGFCLLNDSVIAIVKILSESKKVFAFHSKTSPAFMPLIWIIDLDAHKGDGTAELIHFARRRGELLSPESIGKNGGKPCVLTLSIHMEKGWPLDEESLAAAVEGRAPLVPSDVDIGINSGEEENYTPRLAGGIAELERLSAEFMPGKAKPDLVLVVDGADTYEYDELVSTSPLKLTLEQCMLRDNFVYRYVMDRKIPSAWIQAGGYGSRAWEPHGHFLMGVR